VDTTLTEEDSLEEDACRTLALVWLFPQVRAWALNVGQGPWHLGRGADCEILLDDPGASRRHAVVFFKGPLVVLRDLESRNGTFVNGVRINQVPIPSLHCSSLPGAVPKMVTDEANGHVLTLSRAPVFGRPPRESCNHEDN
jgi:hypothetical protein